VTSILDFYHNAPYERKNIAKATLNREVSEEIAKVVGLPPVLLAPEEDPVLEGPVPVPVLVPVERTEEAPLWPEEEGLVPLAVGRAA